MLEQRWRGPPRLRPGEPVGEADDKGVQHVQLYVTRQGYTMADLAR